MRKNFGMKTWLYPMPVMIIGTYDENGVPNAMNAAWGGIYDTNQIMVCLADSHKTTENIKKSGAFTVSFATKKTVVRVIISALFQLMTYQISSQKRAFTRPKASMSTRPSLTSCL